MKLFNHNQLKKQREHTAHLEPFIASNDGYVLSQGMRHVVLRVALGPAPIRVWQREHIQERLDMPGLSAHQGKAVIDRLCQLRDIEDCAMDLQRMTAKMRMIIRKLYDDKKLDIPAHLRVEMSCLLRDTAEFA